eukprot:g71414.t1
MVKRQASEVAAAQASGPLYVVHGWDETAHETYIEVFASSELAEKDLAAYKAKQTSQRHKVYAEIHQKVVHASSSP